MFFQAERGSRVIQQAEPITGRKALKQMLEEQLHQRPADADAILQQLDSEGSAEISHIVLFDEDVVSLGLR
jgi:hypothetical protein